MQKLFVFAVIVAIIACVTTAGPDRPGPTEPFPLSLDSCYCANATKPQTIPCPDIPHEVVGPDGTGKFGQGYGGGLSAGIQPFFDVFSWQSFIALNWPADASGQPLDTMIGDVPAAPRVWESYNDPSTVFGQTPGPCESNALAAGKKLLKRTSKNTRINTDGSFLEADGHPLIDRNLNFAVYEIKLNPDESEFITRHNLTTKQGQAAYARTRTIEMPVGRYDNDTSRTGGPVGAIELKATWRILDTAAGDDPRRFYHREAVIYVDSANVESGQPLCIEATVGLVGLHISHKTDAFKFWVWSTFEHVDNTPAVPSAVQPDDTARYSFYSPGAVYYANPNTPPALTKADSATGRYHWGDTAPYAATYAFYDALTNRSYGSQITRELPRYAPTVRVDDAFRNKVKGTVWENYMLIGSQWRLKSDGPPFPLLDAPNLLANTTLESYIQSTASCLQCHSNASTSYKKFKYTTDFSFVLDIFAPEE